MNRENRELQMFKVSYCNGQYERGRFGPYLGLIPQPARGLWF